MGISGLLQGIKVYTTKSNIQNWKGQSIAVDTSSWLHKAVYSIADHYVETIERYGRPDEKCIRAATDYVKKQCSNMIRFAGIERIYLVMDGERCPLKAGTNEERERRRQANLKQAREYRARYDRAKMYEKYKACIKVKASLGEAVAKRVSKELSRNVVVVWSPYEADAQLVKLAKDGHVQGIITEDSDVLVYAATCNTSVPVLLKMDSGECDVVSADFLLRPATTRPQPHTKKRKKASGLEPFIEAFALRENREKGLGVRLFVQACVLAGCDYAPNELTGVGTVTAFKHIRNCIHRQSSTRFEHALRLAKGYTDQYELLLSQSESIFYYHPVRCIVTNEVVYLNEPKVHESAASSHLPCMDRFGSNWASFLGEKRCSIIPKQSVFTKSLQPKQVMPAAVKTISNPYSRRPLTASSPNRKSFARMFESYACPEKENPKQKAVLGKFRCMDAPSVAKKARQSMCLNDKALDVRFVKPTFPRDGQRIGDKVSDDKRTASASSSNCSASAKPRCGYFN